MMWRGRWKDSVRVVAATLLVTSIVTSTATEAQQGKAPPPPSVIVDVARERDVSEQQAYTGRIEAIASCYPCAHSGFIKRRGFEEGAKSASFSSRSRRSHIRRHWHLLKPPANANAALVLVRHIRPRHAARRARHRIAGDTRRCPLEALPGAGVIESAGSQRRHVG